MSDERACDRISEHRASANADCERQRGGRVSEALIAVALVWAAVAGTAVVLTRDPLRQAFTAGFFGLALAFLYLSLQSGDVALSQIVVGAIALPLIVLLSLAKVRKDQE
jgi:energy-converting hydrogenase B subunit D